jgi:DNA polymerase elongation subunit (family B)
MIEKIRLDNILFLDIETVPLEENFNSLDDEMKQLWEQKTQYQRKDEFTAEEFYDRAGIWAEFGKIVCISVGYFTTKGDIRNFRVTSFFGEEKKILLDFNNLLNNHFDGSQNILCGHNAKEFDFPFIARRMIINNVSIPNIENSWCVAISDYCPKRCNVQYLIRVFFTSKSKEIWNQLRFFVHKSNVYFGKIFYLIFQLCQLLCRFFTMLATRSEETQNFTSFIN